MLSNCISQLEVGMPLFFWGRLPPLHDMQSKTALVFGWL